MRTFTFMISAALLTLVSKPDQRTAQGTQPQPAPFAWTTSGETLADFKVSIELTDDFDQTSAEACVRSFLRMADGRDSSANELSILNARIGELVGAELAETLNLSVPASLQKPSKVTPKAVRATPDAEWTLEVMDNLDEVFSEVETTPAGGIRIKLPSKEPMVDDRVGVMASRPQSKDGVPSSPQRFAFMCRKAASGDWQILEARRHAQHVSTPSSHGDWPREPITHDYWIPLKLPFAHVQSFRPPDDEVLTEPDRSYQSKEELLQGLFRDLLKRRNQLVRKALSIALEAWLSAVTPLFDAASLTTMKEQAAEITPKATPDIEYSVLSQDDTQIVLQRTDHYATQWVLKINDPGGEWRVLDMQRRFVAKRVRDGAQVETFRDVASFWDLATEDAQRIGLPMFILG